MNIIKGYWKSHGKVPIGKEEQRILYSEPPKGDYVAVYKDGVIARIDIDDYSHKTGEIEEPLKGLPRSKAVFNYLDLHNYQYSAIKTEHGYHIIMRLPENLEITSNKLNWLCALGIRLEIHVTKVFEPMVVNGKNREFIKGSFESELDPLPVGLYPIQKSKEKPFLMEFQTGDRNNHFSEYAFYLANKGFNVDAVKEVITSINDFVLDEHLEDAEIETILRPETLEKLEKIESIKVNGAVNPNLFRNFLNKIGLKLKYNEVLNVVEYENISKIYEDITDVQNVAPIQLQFDFRNFVKKQNITKGQILDLIVLEADKNSFNPIKEYLTCAVWDEKDRFNEVYKALGVSDALEQSLIRKWFIQCVAMVFNSIEKPIQAEGVLVLQGAEGIGKTRFFQKMAVNPLWFSSLNRELSTNNKDVLIQMLSVWIAEMGEVDRTFKANKSDIKAFITSTDDRIRKPYRAEPITSPRTTSFCGTTNEDVFLNDEIGFRRWWIIHVNKRVDIDNFLIGEELHQFWVQCYSEYIRNPQCFRLSHDEFSQLREKNKESRELLPSEEELRNRFDFDSPIDNWNWCFPSALIDLLEYDVSRYKPEQIGKAITRIMQDDNRIKKKRTKSGFKYFIPPSRAVDRFRN